MGRHFARKSKPQKHRDPVIVEPQRLSLLNVLENNFNLAKRRIFVHRYLYVGELIDDFAKRSQVELNSWTVADLMKSNVTANNSAFCYEKISGIFLYYDKFFFHMLEGPEGTINRHLYGIISKYGAYWKNIKLISVVHHIQARFTSDWISYYGKPPTRVEGIDPLTDLENSMRYARGCCKKFYQFATALVEDYNRAMREMKLRQLNSDEEIELDFGAISSPPARSENRLQSIAVTKSENLLPVVAEPYRKDLPEVLLLDFLVNCNYMMDLNLFSRVYGHIAEIDNYDDRVWPHPCNFIPYNVFDKPHDPITDLPIEGDNELTNLEETKEEESESVSNI